MERLSTFEVALDPQVPHAEAEDRQLVQPGAHLLWKGQEVHEPVELPIQPVPVALGGVGLNHLPGIRDLLSGERRTEITDSNPDLSEKEQMETRGGTSSKRRSGG